MLRAERIEDANELGVTRIAPDALEILGTDERVADHLVEPEAGEDSAHDVSRLARIGPVRRQRGLRQPPVDALVAVRPRDFLGDVGRDDDVQPVRRHLDLELVALSGDGELERLQQLSDARGVDLDAEQPAHAAGRRPPPGVVASARGRCRRSRARHARR